MPGQPTPPLIVEGFGAHALGANIQNPIPVAFNPSAPGRACWDVGFPPQTLTPVSLGGTPPQGQDATGVLFAATANIAAMTGGQFWPFNATWAAANGGYAPGAIVAMANGTGFWLNYVSGNTNNPDTTLPQTSGWSPAISLSAGGISASGGAILLTAPQSAFPIISVSGALTSNAFLILPTWTNTWTIFNLTTGPYTVTFKTYSGTGVIIPQGGYTYPAVICGDGTNIQMVSSPLGNVVLNPPSAGLQTITGPLQLNAVNPFLSLWNTAAIGNNRNWSVALTATQLNITAVSDDFSTASLGIQFIRNGVLVTQVNLGGTSQTGTTQSAGDNSTNLATTAYVITEIFDILNNSPTLGGTPTAPTAAAGTVSTQVATTAFVSQNIGSTVASWQPGPVSGIGSGYTAIIANTGLVPGGVYDVEVDYELSYGTSVSNSLSSRVIVTTGSSGIGSTVPIIGGGLCIAVEGPTSGSNSNIQYANAASATNLSIFNSTTQRVVLRGTFTMPATASSVTHELAVSSGTLAVVSGYCKFTRVS